MSERELTDVEVRVRDAVRTLPVPAADPAYRARLKADFVAGTIPLPARTPEFAPEARRRLRLETAWRWALVPLAAAAAFIVAGVMNRGPVWRLADASGEGIATVDGRAVPMNHLDELARRLVPGARVRIPDGASIEMMSAGTLAIQLTPGTDLTIPRVPGRWWARRVDAEVRAGEIRIMSGRRFRGARLAIETPAAAIEMTGTTLAVICDPEGTCVCVLEGHARVGPKGGKMASVSGGMRRFVFLDTRPPELAAMRDVERVKLGELRSQYRVMME